jgi:hypothetical protein
MLLILFNQQFTVKVGFLEESVIGFIFFLIYANDIDSVYCYNATFKMSANDVT